MATVTPGKTQGGKFNGKIEIALDDNEKQMVLTAKAQSIDAAKRQALSLFKDALAQEEARLSTNFDAEIARLQEEQAKSIDFGTIE